MVYRIKSSCRLLFVVVGLMTCDVTGLGIVVSIDRQPTIFSEGVVEPLEGPLDRRRLVGRASHGFAGFVTAIGTETIGDVHAATFIERHSRESDDEALPQYANGLASALTDAWKVHRLTTGLFVHIAGVVDHEPVFWIVNNIGDMQGTRYVDIGTDFRAVNDLDDNLVPSWADSGSESKMDVLGRKIGYLRNGALEGLIEPFDDFNALMTKLYRRGYQGFTPFSSVQAYGSLVRMRCEFVKRIFKPSKGLYAGVPPTNGPTEVVAVDLDGNRWEIPLKDKVKRFKSDPQGVG